MRRHFWFCVIALVVSLGGTVSAQQSFLVEHNDKDDPCSRFKMRILMPAYAVDNRLRVTKPVEVIDPRMVWNPCPKDEPQLALAPPVPAPDKTSGSLVKESFKFRPSTEISKQEKRAEFLSFGSQSPSTFRFSWQK